MNHQILTRDQNRYMPMIYTIWIFIGASFGLWLALPIANLSVVALEYPPYTAKVSTNNSAPRTLH